MTHRSDAPKDPPRCTKCGQPLNAAKTWGAQGGKAANANRSDAERQAIGRAGARKRWANAPCKTCNGSQTIGDAICSSCGGTGKRG